MSRVPYQDPDSPGSKPGQILPEETEFIGNKPGDTVPPPQETEFIGNKPGDTVPPP